LTRLKPDDIRNVPRTLEKYDEELRQKTGCTLLEIAEDAAQAKTIDRQILRRTHAAVVPIASGKGVIGGSAQAVEAILSHIGVNALITHGVDIVGLSEAYERGSDLVFVADDMRFVAINLHSRRVVDNAVSTAKAYVAALDRMAEGLTGKSVLVIGVGEVGHVAISALILRNARPLAYDVDRLKLRDLNRRFTGEIVVLGRLSEGLRQTDLIINAAPGKNIINAKMVKERTLISAPAMPLGLTKAAVRKVGRNLIHDPLQLGVATMAFEACAN